MVDLYPIAAGAGLSFVPAAGVKVAEVTDMPLWSLSPLTQNAAPPEGFDWPAAGRFAGKGAVLAWFGHDAYMLMGVAPDAGAATGCAVVDQSDGWAVFDISGPLAGDVLARLSPIDTRVKALPNGSSMRTELAHMQAGVLRLRKDRFRVLVFRSMAGSFAHEVNRAVQSVDSLAGL
ncbi:MAG: sarcosine oxidase subunit gamma [Planktomarina sp.]